MFGEEWVHSGGSRRRTSHNNKTSTPAGDAQPPRQSWWSWDEFLGCVYQRVPRRFARSCGFRSSVCPILRPCAARAPSIQQIAPAVRKADKEGHYPDLDQVSLIAARDEERW